MEDDHHRKLYSLSEAILNLKTVEEAHRFLADLCTPSELKALSERWSVCQLLYQGRLSYREIHAETNVSLATIVRVARFLKLESNHGYKKLLEKLNSS